VHIDVIADQSVQVTGYESGLYSVIGYARQGLPPAAAVRYTTDAKLKSQLQLVPAGLTFWAAFNISTGPFAGVANGLAGRHAFSTAIDRNALAAAVCNQGTACVAATGGVISKGLAGYIGGVFDAGGQLHRQRAVLDSGVRPAALRGVHH